MAFIIAINEISFRENEFQGNSQICTPRKLPTIWYMHPSKITRYTVYTPLENYPLHGIYTPRKLPAIRYIQWYQTESKIYFLVFPWTLLRGSAKKAPYSAGLQRIPRTYGDQIWMMPLLNSADSQCLECGGSFMKPWV